MTAIRHHSAYINPDALILSCRIGIAQAFYTGSYSAALAALAAGSIRLARHVVEGVLSSEDAFGALEEVAENLGLVRQLGQDAVDVAIDTGPAFYDQLAVAA